MTTVSELLGHAPFEIVHWKIFEPVDNPFTFEVSKPGVAGIPVPEIKDHDPVPISGVLPVNTELVAAQSA